MFWTASPVSGRRLFQSPLCLRGTIAPATASQAGVEQVSERVAEYVGAPDDDEQGKPGPERQRRDPLHVAASFPTEPPSPAGDIGGQPKTKEAQGGLGNDHVANGHGEDDDHGRYLLYSAMSRFVAIRCHDLSSY